MSDFLRSMVTTPAESRPYAPFLPAMEQGIVDFDTLIVRHLPDSIGVILANGRLPQQNDAGIVPLNPDATEFVAVDHTRLIGLSGNTFRFGPSDKDAINKETGEIQQEGLLTVTTPEGFLRIVGMAIDPVENPWLAIRHNALRSTGRLAVVSFGLNTIDCEATGVNTKTSIVTAKPRIGYW